MGQTRRQAIIELLLAAPSTVRNMSTVFGAPIHQIVEDLDHISKSKATRLHVAQPAECLGCEASLDKRRRYTAPSRCPICRSERTTEPLLRLIER